MADSCLNYLSEHNGAAVISVTSQQSDVRGVLQSGEDVSDMQKQWVSGSGLPQTLTIDIGALRERPPVLKCFGWMCRKACDANPALVDVLASADGKTYEKLASLPGRELVGPQLHSIKPLFRRFTHLQVIIQRTFGSSQVYISKLYLLEEVPREVISPSTDLKALLSQTLSKPPRSQSAMLRAPSPLLQPADDLSALQATVDALAQQVQSLQTQLTAKPDVLSAMKQELLQELDERDGRDETLRAWQEEVLEKRLDRFEQRIWSLVERELGQRGRRYREPDSYFY